MTESASKHAAAGSLASRAILEDEGSRVMALVPAAVLLAWGVPVVLSLLVDGGGVVAPLTILADVALHARFLVALPLLIIVIFKLDARLGECQRQFVAAGIIGRGARPAYDAAAGRAAALRTSLSALVACVALAFASAVAYAVLFGAHLAPAVGPNWHLSAEEGRLTLAGWWHLLVSQPVYALAVFWLGFRVGVVWWLFWRVSGLDLHLNALHGDEAAGLGFLRNLIRPMTIAAFAVSTSAAGSLADLMLYADAAIGDYVASIGVFALLVSVVLAAPLAFFSPAIRRARRRAILEYGIALRHRADDFRAGTARGSTMRDAAADAELLTYSNAIFATVQRTHVLIQRLEVLKVATAALVPFALVASLQLPADTIVQQLKLFL